MSALLPPGRRLLIIVPAFNEAASIGRVVRSVREAIPVGDVLVVNDGSSDATSQEAEAAGAHVIDLPHNLGIGAAVQTGFIFARERGYDYAVQVDGDGQHDPRQIADLLAPVLNDECDVAVGARIVQRSGYITPVLRRLGIALLATTISLATRQRVSDATSGFRASNRKAICYCAREYPADYPEPESLVLFWRAGIRTREVPVTMNARLGGQSSITLIRSAYYMAKVFLAIMIDLIREAPRAADAPD